LLKVSALKGQTFQTHIHRTKEVTWPKFSGERCKILAQRRGTASHKVKLDPCSAGIYKWSTEKRTVHCNVMCPTLCIVF